MIVRQYLKFKRLQKKCVTNDFSTFLNGLITNITRLIFLSEHENVDLKLKYSTLFTFVAMIV